jgi:sorbitol-specific phosphotransferase system component IIBC
MQIVMFKGKYNLFTTTKAIEQISQQIVVLAMNKFVGNYKQKQMDVFMFQLIVKCASLQSSELQSLKLNC